jgi:GPI mannosyltransferase 1 subunit M
VRFYFSAHCSFSSDNACSPYARSTYRYTPLLALILTPNEWLHQSFGKYLFALCDIVNGSIIYHILVNHILPFSEPTRDKNASEQDERRERDKLATIYSALHLLNPMVFSISTRGSSESILVVFVLLTLHCALSDRWYLAAVMLGVSTHWKIYPLVYGAACLAVVGGTSSRSHASFSTYVNKKSIMFGVVSASSFVVMGMGCYAM